MYKKLVGILFAVVLVLGVVTLPATATEAVHPHDGENIAHCVCGGSAVGVHDHACETVTWLPLPEGTENFASLDEGNYYLTADLQITDYSNLTKNLSICLNGYNVTSTDYRIFGNTRAGMTLNLCDCSGVQDTEGNWSWSGTMYGPDYTGTGNAYGAILYTHAGSVANIYGGNYIGGGNQVNGSCFVVANDGYSATGISGATNTTPGVESTMNIYNGYIQGTQTKGSGGTIQQFHSSVLNVYGGTITGGTATSGGNISAGSNCVVNIAGGVISGGTASTGSGGNISSGKITVTGGLITGGSAKSNGGNIYAPATLTVSGGTISDGFAETNKGGNVYVSGTKLTINGGAIVGGTTKNVGGGIFVSAATAGTISGAPVIDGNERGNLYFARNCPVTIGQLTEGAKIGVLYADTWHKVTVSHTPTEDVVNYIFSDSPEAYFTFSGTTMKQTAKSEEYKQTISGYEYFDNTLDEALPMTVVYKLMTDHFESELPEGKTAKKAIVIGYDAVRTDALEFVTDQNSGIFAVAEDGGLYHAYAGGEYGGDTQQMTVTSVGWTTMFTGYYSRTHGVTKNHASTINAGVHTFFTELAEAGNSVLLHGDSIIKEKDADGNYTKFFPEHWVNDIAYQETQGLDVTYSGVNSADTSINADALLEIIGQEEMPDVIWYYQAEPDNQGHSMGWGGHIPEYVEGVQVTDSNGYDIYTAIKARPTYEQEDWLVIVTTDHGGYLTQHGEHSAQERSTWIASNKTIDYADTAYTAYDRLNEDTVSHTHCACGTGFARGKGDHTCQTEEWLPWYGTDSLPDGEGNYYLTADVDLSNATDKTYIRNGTRQRLCLNGHTITGPTNALTIWWVGQYFSLCDCVGTGAVNASADVSGSVLHVFSSTTVSEGIGGTFEMFGGTMTSTGTGSGGGIIFLGNSGSNLATFNFYGGTLQGGTSEEGAGGVTTHGNMKCLMNMYGGTIRDCTGGGYGGGVSISANSEFNMYDGTIENCTSTTAAGNLYIYGLGKIYDGTIQGGVSKEGGNISVGGKGTLYLYGGLITEGGYRDGTVTTTRGGNMSVFGKLYMYGGTVSNGKAVSHGGNVGAYNCSVFEIGKTTESLSDPKLIGGEAQYGGNVSISGNSSSTIETVVNLYDGATITGGVATSSGEGGNFHLGMAKYTLNMYGGTISDGGNSTTTTQGGNLFLYGKFNMYGGEITGGTAKNQGGNISGWGSYEVTIGASDRSTTTPVISGGTASGGGNVVLRGTAPVLNMSCGSATGGTATSGGGLYVTAGTVNLSGTARITDNTTSNIYLKSGFVANASDLSEGAAFGVTLETTTGVFAKGTSDKTYFTSDNQDLTMIASGDTLALASEVIAEADGKTYVSLQEAVDKATTFVKLLGNVTEDVVIAADTYLDLNGFTLTGNISGEGTLYGMDSATDLYTCDKAGRIEGTVSCNLAGNFKTSVTGAVRRYLAVEDAEGYTFHRFYMGITHMSLKPGVTGVGYKAVFAGDDVVKSQLAASEAYGFVLWVGESGAKHTFAKNGGDFRKVGAVTMRVENFDVANYGETPIYGQVFMKLADGTVIEGSVYSYTLRELVEYVAAHTEDYSVEQIKQVKAMVETYKTEMAAWNIDALLLKED